MEWKKDDGWKKDSTQGEKKEMIDHRELNFISHFSMRGHENRYLLSYCKGVEKKN